MLQEHYLSVHCSRSMFVVCMAGKNVIFSRNMIKFPTKVQYFPTFLRYFFVSNSWISHLMTKFPENQVPQFPTFSGHGSMLLEQCAFQIWSWSTFDLEYSSRVGPGAYGPGAYYMVLNRNSRPKSPKSKNLGWHIKTMMMNILYIHKAHQTDNMEWLIITLIYIQDMFYLKLRLSNLSIDINTKQGDHRWLSLHCSGTK